MKYVIVAGGLGNQMFQYALLIALRNNRHKVMMELGYYDFSNAHSGFELQRVFGINEKTENFNRRNVNSLFFRLLNKLVPYSVYSEDNSVYNVELLINPRKYIKGFWQDERYFNTIRKDVLEVFKFRDIDERNLALADEMRRCDSVSLHIRRGDYITYGFPIIGIDYYKKAVKYLTDHILNPVFYIFSDDCFTAESMAKSLRIDYKLITHNKGYDSYKDMFLMSQSQNNIIANSSFSWWGAWLNQNTNKIVIAPRNWDERNPDFQPQSSSWTLL